MNKIFLSGNLTRDPEVRYTQSGKAIARMGIAVKRQFSKENAVDFFNLQAWERTAEFCQRYLVKGSRVLVEGRLQTYNYEGQDGTKKSGVDIIIDNIEFAGSKREENSENRPSYENDNSARKNSKSDFEDDFAGEDISDDDVPF